MNPQPLGNPMSYVIESPRVEPVRQAPIPIAKKSCWGCCKKKVQVKTHAHKLTIHEVQFSHLLRTEEAAKRIFEEKKG